MKKINALIGQGLSHPKASQKGGFPLAGPLSLIFSSVKVTALEESKPYAGVTVSMTSEDSAGYANLNSPKRASAKYRQHQIPMPEVTVTSRNPINGLASAHMVGVCAGNLLNIKPESAFVQTTGKEKGPRQVLRIIQLLTCEEANELHHNSYLQATGNLSYSRHQHLNKTGAGFSIPSHTADISRYKRFFCVRNQRCAPIMVGRSGGALALAGFCVAGMLTPIRLATPFSIGERGLKEPTQEAATMATAQTRPEFIDTYWIIPEYSSEPYGKVSFTRQDRRTFIALFKGSRLIWAGRQPVSDFTQGLKDPKSQKVGVKHTMLHEGIEEISIPQGGVNITPPLTPTITEIVTVPATVSDIATVQGVAHV